MAIGMTFVISTGGIDISVGMNALFTMALMYRLNSFGVLPVWAVFIIFDIKADVLVSLALIASICIGETFAAGEVA
ncbi:cation-transporting P-type ATPase, partial [Anaerotruncus colihominis]|nr:cation-transporting P-type ATPase [Anaerotruncus colihominis]